MSKLKFTPGPWHVEEFKYPSDSGYFYILAGEQVIGDGVLMHMGHKHNSADASLIAAAPELYTILETIVISGKLPLDLYANAKKVLQKARGEQ